jgi:DNA (cytosine-5)-methyltransferase 3A
MKVLSLFDGISCARVGLERAGIKVEKYYASELDKYAIQVAQKNYPDTVQLGDVKLVNKEMVGEIDLLIGGFPCQSFSISGNRKGFDDVRGHLYLECVRLLKELNPKWFIFENVASMKKDCQKIISEAFGVNPICINASLVSAQNRKRLFWTNIPNVTQPHDRNIYLKDVIENGEPSQYSRKFGLKDASLKSLYLNASDWRGLNRNQMQNCVKVGDIGNGGQGQRVYSLDGKSVCLSANGGGCGAKTGLYAFPVALTEARTEEAKRIRSENLKNGKDWSPRRSKELVPRTDGKSNCLTTGITKEHLIFIDSYYIRKLTPIECERLQGLKDNYTEGISNTQRYKCLGNAFNVDVIAHILSFATKE